MPISYKTYAKDFEKFIPYIKERISSSNTGSIRIREQDIVNGLGKEYDGIKFPTLYVALKVILLNEGIFVSAEHTRQPDNRCYIMRFGTEKDIIYQYILHRYKSLRKNRKTRKFFK